MKKTGWISAFSFFTLLAVAGVAAAAQPTCDETAVASAKAAIDLDCPCAGLPDGNGGTVPWKNHGQYVRCVTKARKTEALNAGVARQCLKGVVPCAANSTCGKSSAVACVTTSGTCLNDPTPGDTVAEGTCDNDPTKACDTDQDCSVASCAVMSPDECTLAVGSAAIGTCCSQ
jgi:hypothetical protein